MAIDTLDVVGIETEREAVINPTGLAGVFAFVVLIIFSSTKTAGDASEYAYNFYLSFLPTIHKFGVTLPHLLAAKSIHFLLFFSLGTWLFRSLQFSRSQRLWVTIFICFLIGTVSEVLQRFTARDPSFADLVLNLASGTLAAVLASRNITKASDSFFRNPASS